jgi:hypothetical protein
MISVTRGPLGIDTVFHILKNDAGYVSPIVSEESTVLLGVANSLAPPRLPSGIKGPIRSIRRPLGHWDIATCRGHNVRDFRSFISAAPPNQAAILESRMIHMIQELTGQTLRQKAD